MIAGAFSFDVIMIVVSAKEKIMPQTIEHLDILNILGLKKAIVVITKKDLVTQEELETNTQEILEFINSYDFDIVLSKSVSIYEEHTIEELKEELFKLEASEKPSQNFFRYYVDRVFSTKGSGTIVTGTVLGNPIYQNEKVFICDLKKEVKLKAIQVHGKDTQTAQISNRAALNLQNIDINLIKKGFIISKKGFLRGFNQIDISYNTLRDKELLHNALYSIYLGSKKIEARILILEEGLATIKSQEEIYSIYGEKLIIRQGNSTIAGGVILNPIIDPMKKSQKLELMKQLKNNNISDAYKILIKVHKKGLGLVSSAQRFALSHEEALLFAKNLEDCFIDEKALVIYPMQTKDIIKDIIKDIYKKNKYALLSNSSISLRLVWASENFIELVLEELCKEQILIKDGNLYKNANIKEDIIDQLETIILTRLKEENFTPTAPYNIYDELDIDRKLGDTILKALTSKKQVIRIQHNLFIEAQILTNLINTMKNIIKKDGYIDIQNFKNHYNMSRKYMIAYLDYLDKLKNIENKDGKRYLIS
jgi:selenocysteine-specific elongation factor